MKRSFSTLRNLNLVLLTTAAASSFAACIPFDTEEDYILPPNGPTEVVTAAKPPPPISGGTLAISNQKAVAADPDRDRVWIVDLSDKSVAQVVLQENDEPGRVAIDGAGRAHVALRQGGAIVSIDIASAKIVERRAVCSAPRGIAYDKTQDLLHIACVGGELVSLPAAGGNAVRKLRLDSDLRDVVVQDDQLIVSRFSSAELITVKADGSVGPERHAPPAFSFFEQQFEPAVAWRTIGIPNGRVAMVHQRAMTTPVRIEPGGYGSGGCDNSIVHGTVTSMPTASGPAVLEQPMPAIPFTTLPVDIAVDAAGNVAVASAGNDTIIRTSMDNLNAEAQINKEFGGCSSMHQANVVEGRPIAVAFDNSGRLLVQTREPARLVLVDENNESIAFPAAVSVRDTGHDMFHTNPGGFSPMACASCHPEGGTDGRVWNFDPIGPRRTQYMRGGILNTLPLHWDGDMDKLDTLMAEVFVNRMGGMAQGPRRVNAFANWLNALPAIPVSEPADIQAAERGKALFNDAKVGCADCHQGSLGTNNKSSNVGTGKEFQVPTLVNIGLRAPFMHDGCAPTLRDRFTNTACGGGDKHGITSQLSPADIDDLVVYLETL